MDVQLNYIQAPELLDKSGHFYFNMRVSIFIDGNNFYFGLKKIYDDRKNLGDFDFEKFCNFLAGNYNIVDIFYYNAPLDYSKDFKKYGKQQKFFWKLGKIPKFNLILCKLLKRRIVGTNKYYYVLKEDDIHMAVDLVKGAFKDEYDKAVVVSGDGVPSLINHQIWLGHANFVPAVKAAQEENKVILNACFKKSASTNLKKNCEGLIKLNSRILDEFLE